MRLHTYMSGLTTLAVAGLMLAWPCPVASAQAGAPRTVLAIHGGPEFFPGVEAFDRAIRNTLLSSPDVPVNYFAEYLESEELTLATASKALAESIRLKFEGRRIDVLIANTVPALEFVLRLREELYPGAPVVFIAAAVPEAVARGTAGGVTGLVRSVAMKETLELALQLHPSVRQVFVVAYAPAVDGYAERVRSTLSEFSQRVQLTYIDESTLAGMVAAVKALPPRSLILYTRYSPVDVRRVVYPDELIAPIARAAAVPVYAGTGLYMGRGVVGGIMQGDEAAGTHIGQITRRILEGTPPDEIPIESPPLVPTFDWRQLKRWGIDPSTLPPGSEILFRTPTTWEAYKWYIVGAIVVVSAQLLLIAALLAQRARRRRAEETILTREASLRTSYERIRQLAGRLINAQEAARATIARDLHDDVCQRLSNVSIAVSGLKTFSGDIQGARAQQAFAELQRDMRATFDCIRRLSHDLHPATLRVLGLAPALNAHCAEVARLHGVQVAFTTGGDLGHLHPDVALCLFRIAQESLRNGIVHGEAPRFDVSLVRSGDEVELTVTDHGRGFDLEAVRRAGTGLGLVSMEERAHAVGANLHIVTALRQGTTIRVRGPAEPPLPVSALDVGRPSGAAERSSASTSA
jgi:signal transduction histidine kinase